MPNSGYNSFVRLAKGALRLLIEAVSKELANGRFFFWGRNRGKVFGIGWAETGTTTLARCFQILGYSHQSQRMDLVDDLRKGNLRKILSVARAYESFDDWPWIVLFKELDSAFPGSKFILTRRNPQRWISSYRNMLHSQGDATERMNEIRRILYGLPFPNVTDEQLLQRYNDHNAEVMAHFAGRTDCLLVVDWERGDSWEEVCRFLHVDIPDVSFPHENRGDYQVSG